MFIIFSFWVVLVFMSRFFSTQKIKQDEHLENIRVYVYSLICIAGICIKPDIDELVSKNQARRSHEKFSHFFQIDINIFFSD